MKISNNKSGFTLIEIIVVLIIVGVLASIALPNLYTNIAKSKGAEAVASFGAMKASLEGCGQKNSAGGTPTYAACTTQGLGGSGNFFYTLGTSTCSAGGGTTAGVGDATGWCIYAYSPSTGTNGTNYITLNRTSSTAINCTGYGTYAGIC